MTKAKVVAGMKRASVVQNGISAQLPVFTPQECQSIIDWAVRDGIRHEALVHTRQEASREQLRRCTEYLIEPHLITLPDGSSVASRVYGAFAVGNVWELEYSEVPSIRVIRYEGGDGYGPHTDWSNRSAKYRKLSMTVQLSNPDLYTGGDVGLMAGPETFWISRSQGVGTVWPSWTLHEVCSVGSGERYSLTAWAHGSPYK